jgi:hypothetical protein
MPGRKAEAKKQLNRSQTALNLEAPFKTQLRISGDTSTQVMRRNSKLAAHRIKIIIKCCQIERPAGCGSRMRVAIR